MATSRCRLAPLFVCVPVLLVACGGNVTVEHTAGSSGSPTTGAGASPTGGAGAAGTGGTGNPSSTVPPGGAAGSPGTGGAGGQIDTFNYCECTLAWFVPACGNCVNQQAYKSDTCKPLLLECQLDGGCTSLINCPSYCVAKPQDEQIACVQDCFSPFPDDESHQLVSALLDCLCSNCYDLCQPSEPIACDPAADGS